MKIKLTLLTGTMLMALFFTSCWDEPTSTDLVTEQLVSISSYDTSKDFTKYKTFSIPDYVFEVTGDGTQWSEISNSDAQNVLNRITMDLEDAGYTKVDTTAGPDLVVNVGWADITNVIIGYPTWWWDYWYYWDYDWYYPYYPYYSAAVLGSYSVGLLMIQIAENTPDPNTGKYPIIWTGYVRMIEYITVHSNAEIDSAIDDCFKTPPFSIE